MTGTELNAQIEEHPDGARTVVMPPVVINEGDGFTVAQVIVKGGVNAKAYLTVTGFTEDPNQFTDARTVAVSARKSRALAKVLSAAAEEIGEDGQ